MKEEYFDSITRAYFSINSINELKNPQFCQLMEECYLILICAPVGQEIVVDERKIEIDSMTGIFLSPGQRLQLKQGCDYTGHLICFNKEFYCIEYHDSDISCNGILFLNNFRIVKFILDQEQGQYFDQTILEMKSEIHQKEPLQEEMLQTLLKNLLIRSNRIFRSQSNILNEDNVNVDFLRKFSSLVEKNFRSQKTVELYAEMLGLAPASLTKKMKNLGIDPPSKIIKNRVFLEAKRLLIYTDKTIKEIADTLGYEDQFYFSRFFAKEAGMPPKEFKKAQIKSAILK
jgi:AraC-like DNA-binding protein